MVTQTGCDAVMIGRTAPSNPWIFRQIEQYCGGMKMWEGHDFSRAVNAANISPALAAGVGLREDGPGSSGAEAPNYLGELNGTAKAVPFPSVLGSGHLVLGKRYDEPTEGDRYQMIRTYFQMLIEEELPDAVGKMKQFASWFTHGVPGGAGLRKEIYESKSAPEILSRVEEFFEASLCVAGASSASSE
jgi:tRNA-dihydrouridine synthase